LRQEEGFLVFLLLDFSFVLDLSLLFRSLDCGGLLDTPVSIVKQSVKSVGVLFGSGQLGSKSLNGVLLILQRQRRCSDLSSCCFELFLTSGEGFRADLQEQSKPRYICKLEQADTYASSAFVCSSTNATCGTFKSLAKVVLLKG
jgi:hypothetical protein